MTAKPFVVLAYALLGCLLIISAFELQDVRKSLMDTLEKQRQVIQEQRETIAQKEVEVWDWRMEAFDTLYACDDAKEERNALRVKQQKYERFWKTYGNRVVMIEPPPANTEPVDAFLKGTGKRR